MSKSIKSLFAGVVTVMMVVTLMPAGAPKAQAATLDELLAQLALLQTQITALQGGTGTVSCDASVFVRNLTVGSTGADVKALQQFLNAKSYTVSISGAGSAGNETTYFGTKTQAAVKAFQMANAISPTLGYFGPITRAKVKAMCVGGIGTTPPGTTPPGTTPPGATGNLTLSLASDNPAAVAVPKGAAGVTFLKFNVMGTGTLNSLTFKRVGIGATADFASAGVYLFDGTTRLTTGRSVNSTTHEVVFLNLALAISGTKTLSLVADVATGATTGNRSAFQLTGATGTPGVTLTTLMGNEMTIAGQSVGGVTVTSGAAPTNPKVGQQGAKLAEFKISANSVEDVNVMRVSLTEGGSIANTNLTNFVLKQAGNTIATASAIGGKDLIVFNFTNPFLLEKGQERTFEVYGDISGLTRSSDTIVLYFDSKADVYAVGKTYGFPVNPDITGLDTTGEGDTLTVQGGDITITFNGPVASDIALRGQDVVLYDFTIASQNNVEIRNLRMSATTTLLDTGEGFNDFKVWDKGTNSVVTSAVDITTSTTQTFTDVINISAGQSKTFKVTADVDSDDDASDTIQVHLLAFQSNDIRNLDNNTYVATSVIVPNSTVSGNTMTVKAPTLDIQLSSTPSSQTYAKGSTDKPLAGFAFRAISDNIRLDSVRVTATSSSGTLTSGEVQSLALYDGTTRISSVKSLDSSALNATFDSLNYTIWMGTTNVLTLRGNIATDAGTSDIYYFYLATAGSADITAYDSQSNSATLTGVTANSGGTVTVTVVASGDVTVAKASDTTDTEAGIVLANKEQTLAAFEFTAANEQMQVNKMQLLVVPTSSATATSAASADEAPTVKLYDGATQIGATGGYSVVSSGADSGTVFIDASGTSGGLFTIPKDGHKTITVKGVLNGTDNGADTGASVYTSVMAAGFESQGSTAKDTTITAATGNQKVVYKTKPTINSVVTEPSSKLTVGTIPVLRFKIAADASGDVSWKQIQVKVSMTGATMSAVNADPDGGSGNVVLDKDPLGSRTNLEIASAFSSTSTSTGQQVAITGGNTGYVSLLLAAQQTIPAGTEQEYELKLTFADVSGTVGAASAVINLHRTESTLVNATAVADVRTSLGTATDAAPSLVWSDRSVVTHGTTETTNDWANGVFVKTLPSTTVTLSN